MIPIDFVGINNKFAWVFQALKLKNDVFVAV